MAKLIDLNALATFKSKCDEVYGGSSGASVTVDDTLSSTSTNPVQNKVINTALAGKLSTTGGTVTGAITLNGGASNGLIFPGRIGQAEIYCNANGTMPVLFIGCTGSVTFTGTTAFNASVSLGSKAYATTPDAGDNSTSVATTAFVTTAIKNLGNPVSSIAVEDTTMTVTKSDGTSENLTLPSGGSADLTGYAKLAGADFTGDISAPRVVQTANELTEIVAGANNDKDVVVLDFASGTDSVTIRPGEIFGETTKKGVRICILVMYPRLNVPTLTYENCTLMINAPSLSGGQISILTFMNIRSDTSYVPYSSSGDGTTYHYLEGDDNWFLVSEVKGQS